MMYVLAETFAQRSDIDFHLVASTEGVDGVKVVEKPGVTVHYVGKPRRRIIPNILAQGSRIAPVMRELQPEVVNSHHHITTEAALRAGCKVVHTIHGIAHREVQYASGRYKLATAVQACLLRKDIARADAVTSVSQYGLDSYAPWIKSPTAVACVPVEDVFADVPALDGCKNILYAGRISPLKNPMALVNAMIAVREKHPDARLNVCGGGLDTSYGESVRRFVDDHGLGEVVLFRGVVDRETLAELLADSVCLALPSRQENTPVVIAQAMTAGRAAVATPVGGIPEMIEDGVNGFLVEPDDSETLAARIIELLDDPAKAGQMGAAAKKIATERYDRHKVAGRILEICSSVAGRK